jgi:S-adenosylmethionine:tRNA ribosyltransferase-isomerase
MSPATHPPELRELIRLLLVDEARSDVRDSAFGEIVQILRPGDLLVVNDAATLPAALRGQVWIDDDAHAIELRLLGPRANDDGDEQDRRWRAVLLGAGDWRTDTDERPAPPLLEPGMILELLGGLRATIVSRDPASARLIELCFEQGGPALYAQLYANGRPIQYSHLERDEQLWSFQTVFAGRPWAAEMPSAGRPLTAAMLSALRRRGIEIARLTHAAGLSATGDAQLDARLPLPERYELPPETAAAIERTRARGGRVIAVGTTVVRALESAARAGLTKGGSGETELIITAETPRLVVDGLLTGMHGPTESHYRLLQAFASQALLERAWALALELGYRSHEFGDLALLLPAESRSDRRALGPVVSPTSGFDLGPTAPVGGP